MRALLAGLLLLAALPLAWADGQVTFSRRPAQVGDVRSETLVINSRSANGAQIATWTLVRRVEVVRASSQGAILEARVDQPRSVVHVNFCMFGFPAHELRGSFRFVRDVDTFRVARVGAPEGQDGLTTFSRYVLMQHARRLQAGAPSRFQHALPLGRPVRVGQRLSAANPVGPRLIDPGERTRKRPLFHPFLATFDRQTMTLRRTARLGGVRCGVFDADLATPVGPTIGGLGEGSAKLRGEVWVEVATGRLRRLRAQGAERYRRVDKGPRPLKPVGTMTLRLDVEHLRARRR